MNKDPLASSNPQAISSGTCDHLVSIFFTHHLPSPRVTFEGLAGLRTPKCGIDPVDQSSTMVTAAPLQTPMIPSTANPSASSNKHPPFQGGATA